MEEITIQNINIEIQPNIQPQIVPADKNKKLQEVLPAQIKQNRIQNETRSQTTKQSFKQILDKNKLKIGVGIGIFIIGCIILGVLLGVLLKKKNEGENQNDITPVNPDPIIINQICQTNPSQCSGVPVAAQEYILSTYQQPDQVRALLQTSRTMENVLSNMTNNTRQGMITTYRQILRSAECLAYNLVDGASGAYDKLLQLQFNTVESMQAYLRMAQQFSGQPISLTPTQTSASTCQFQLSPNSTVSSLRSAPVSTSGPLRTSATCNQGTSSLIYFDGVGYGPNHAMNNLQKIKSALQSSSNSITFDSMVAVGAWRTQDSVGFLIGIILAYQQKLLQNNQTPPTQIDLYTCLSIIIQSSSLALRLPSTITREAFKRFLQFFKQHITNQMINSVVQYNIARHKQFVVQQISQGKKVVLVAHSQGTLYANSVYNLLSSTDKQYVKLVYLAPIAATMADNSASYITNPIDYVVLAIQVYAALSGQFATPLPANTDSLTFNQELDFGFNHELGGYVQAYKSTFIQLVKSAKQRAAQPTANLGAGPITVALNWDSQPDIDLHIFQPSGTHVDYRNMVGISGYLDRDDTDGYGPEHYYTSCTQLRQGNYTIRLNYYRGYADSQATVTVSAGPQYLMKTLTIYYPSVASSGNYNPPYFICSINVSLNQQTNSFVFTISEQPPN